MNRFKRWNARRKLNNAFSRFRDKPEKFLREHKVKMFGANAVDEGPGHSVDYTFYKGHKIGRRPGRILGNLRKHDVYEYKVQPVRLGNLFAPEKPKVHLQAAHIGVHRVQDDAHPVNPLPVSHQMTAADSGMYVTTELTGCSLVRRNNNLSHYQPRDNAHNLQTTLAARHADNHIFGPDQYRANYGNANRAPAANVFIRRRPSGTFQSLSQQVTRTGQGSSARVRFDVRRNVLS